MKILFQLFLCFSVALMACNKSVKKEFLSVAQLLPASFDETVGGCRDQANYIPDPNYLDHRPLKYIRVNFHVMCDDEGRGNFDEKSGKVFIDQVMKAANDKLGRNKQMNLPPGNETPVIPIRYRYVLTPKANQPKDDGIYFHNDSELYAMIGKGKHRNNYSKDVFEKYGIQKDTVLNIFLMAHHIDSVESKTYVADQKGIGYPNFVKLTHWYYGVQDTIWDGAKPRTKWNKWNAIKNFHHEVGHTIGLRHTWSGNDGCDDTPRHPNCWNKTKGKKPCDENWSNNFMDYNAHASAWSPCQIGIAHRNFSDKKKLLRKLLVPTWCSLDESKTIHIRDTVRWRGANDLEGHLVIEDQGTLIVSCRLSLPKGAKIMVHPKGTLILDGATLENDCGDQWKGIEIWSKKGDTGIVQLNNNAQILNVENEVSMVDDLPGGD